MMKRRWSNNGGFALRMLEESSSEVTSSSAGLVMAPGIGNGGSGGGGGGVGVGNIGGNSGIIVGGGGITLSPTSLGSPEYGELELWYDDNAYNQHSVIASAMGTGIGGGCTTTTQTGIIQLPPMPHNSINHTPRSASANSISSGIFFFFFLVFRIY